MDKKQLANLNIKCVVLKYSDKIRNQNKKLKYHDELKFLVGNHDRNKFISNLALQMESN